MSTPMYIGEIYKIMVLPNLWYWEDGEILHSDTLDNAILHIQSAFSTQNVGNFKKHANSNICKWNIEATF